MSGSGILSTLFSVLDRTKNHWAQCQGNKEDEGGFSCQKARGEGVLVELYGCWHYPCGGSRSLFGEGTTFSVLHGDIRGHSRGDSLVVQHLMVDHSLVIKKCDQEDLPSLSSMPWFGLPGGTHSLLCHWVSGSY